MKLENVDHLQAKLVTDNDGKRVLLFVDNNGETKYKSIFVKKTNHLKIIKMDGGLVYNGALK